MAQRLLVARSAASSSPSRMAQLGQDQQRRGQPPAVAQPRKPAYAALAARPHRVEVAGVLGDAGDGALDRRLHPGVDRLRLGDEAVDEVRPAREGGHHQPHHLEPGERGRARRPGARRPRPGSAAPRSTRRARSSPSRTRSDTRSGGLRVARARPRRPGRPARVDRHHGRSQVIASLGAVHAGSSTRSAPGSIRRARRPLVGVDQVAQGGQRRSRARAQPVERAPAGRAPQRRLQPLDEGGEVARRGPPGPPPAPRATASCSVPYSRSVSSMVNRSAPGRRAVDLQQGLLHEREEQGRRPRPPAAGRRRRRATAASVVRARREDRQPLREQPLGGGEQVPAPARRRPGASGAAGGRPGCRRSAGGSGRTAAARSRRRGSTPSRAAASSMASGRPSRRRTISTTGPTVGVVQHEARRDGGGPVERAGARRGGRGRGRGVGVRRRERQRGQRGEDLAVDGQRPRGWSPAPGRRRPRAGAGRPARPRRRPGARSCRPRAGCDGPCSAPSEALDRRPAAPRSGPVGDPRVPQPEGGERGVGHPRGLGDRRELDQPGRRPARVEPARRGLHREAGLAGAARTDDRDEPAVAQGVEDPLQVGLAADEAGRAGAAGCGAGPGTVATGVRLDLAAQQPQVQGGKLRARDRCPARRRGPGGRPRTRPAPRRSARRRRARAGGAAAGVRRAGARRPGRQLVDDRRTRARPAARTRPDHGRRRGAAPPTGRRGPPRRPRRRRRRAAPRATARARRRRPASPRRGRPPPGPRRRGRPRAAGARRPRRPRPPPAGSPGLLDDHRRRPSARRSRETSDCRAFVGSAGASSPQTASASSSALTARPASTARRHSRARSRAPLGVTSAPSRRTCSGPSSPTRTPLLTASR